MNLIQRLNKLAAELYISAQRGLRPSRLLTYIIGFSLFLNAGNAFCSDYINNWSRISGPIPIVNQSPIQLLFLQPIPERADIYPKNKFSLTLTNSITNTLLWINSNQYLGYIDMEMIRSSLEMKYGVFHRMEIGMSLPFIYGSGGILDHGILEIEDFFDSPRDLREKEDRAKITNNYTYYVKKNGKSFIEGKDGASGLGDSALSVKVKILDEGYIIPGISARASVKIPTGDDDRAMGSGKVDYGFGLLLQKTVKRVTTYFNADVIFPGEAYEDVDVSLRPFYEIMLGEEFKFTDHLSGLVQLSYITRPFKNTGLDMLDDRIWDVLLGLSYVTKTGLYMQGGLRQDILGSSDTSADITFFLNLGKNF